MKKENISNNLPGFVYSDSPELIRLNKASFQIAIENIKELPGENPRPIMTCMPGVDIIWQWDSCFMALFSKYSNNVLNGLNNLDCLYNFQRDDGYISMAYDIESGEEAYGERVNPPLFAWVEWENYLFNNDKLRLFRIYPILKKYFYWIKNNRRHPDGLYWFKDSGSSGMDNAPRGGRIESETPSDLAHVDLASQQVLSANYMVKIAQELKLYSDAELWLEEAQTLSNLINKHHWCEKHGFYYDVFARKKDSDKHNFTGIKTIAGFWPVISNIADPEKIKRLVQHLVDPSEFWTSHPVPSLSAGDPNYDPKGDYWCGGVWAPTNYMLVRGLQLNGCRSIAKEITTKHLNAMAKVMDNPEWGGIWECYAPESFRPSTKGGGIVRDNFVGWSGIGPIAMLIENVIGLEFDAPENTVNWHLSAPCKHGIENLQFNGGELSLTIDGIKENEGRRIIKLKNTKEVKLVVYSMGNTYPELSEIFSPGKHELELTGL